jgi:hypothetical protein
MDARPNLRIPCVHCVTERLIPGSRVFIVPGTKTFFPIFAIGKAKRKRFSRSLRSGRQNKRHFPGRDASDTYSPEIRNYDLCCIEREAPQIIGIGDSYNSHPRDRPEARALQIVRSYRRAPSSFSNISERLRNLNDLQQLRPTPLNRNGCTVRPTKNGSSCGRFPRHLRPTPFVIPTPRVGIQAGQLLGRVRVGSEMAVDAFIVAVADLESGTVVAITDPNDLRCLALYATGVVVADLR